MKKKFVSLFLSLCLLITLAPTALAASNDATASSSTANSTIDVNLTGLDPGYYLGAVWDGKELLCLFDYIVGNDGTLKTTVDIGKVMPDGATVTVGVSSENAGGKEIKPFPCTVNNSSSNQPSDPTDPDPSQPTGHVYNIFVTSGWGGTVNAPTQGTAGSYIPFTVSANWGYQLESIVVRDVYGNALLLSGSNGQYTFTMPNSSVTIYATFVPTSSSNTSTIGTTTPKPVVSPGTSSSQTPLTVNVFSYGSADVGGMNYTASFTLTANASGGSGGYSYQFEVMQKGKVTKSSGWTTSNVFSDSLAYASGPCTATITVKDSSGNTASKTVNLLKTNGIQTR